MSIEQLCIAAVLHEGTGGLRKVYQSGVTQEDFSVYEDEFAWLEERAKAKKSLSRRAFRNEFPDFEFLMPDERLQDLLVDLKSEKAHSDILALCDTVLNDLTPENAIDRADHMRDFLAEITRQHAPHSDFPLIAGWKSHYEEQRTLRAVRRAGEPPGIPTGFAWIDHHWDGLVDGRFIVVLGRPGEGKTYLTQKFEATAIKHKYRVLKFSPEMNRREQLCRLHTLLSADKEIQKSVGIKSSFRNRALMSGIGYNLKTYKRFLEFLSSNEMGEIILLTSVNRRMKMSPSFIESKIEDLGPDLVVIDPIYKLSPVQQRNSRIEELSEISDAIQDMAEKFNLPVVVTNQAHRQGGRKDDAPHKDTSFNSDVPIQEADHVIGVKNISDERRMIVRCSKSRFGSDFRFECQFFPNTGVFREVDAPTTSYYNGTQEKEDEELEQMIKTAVRGGEDAE